MISPRDLLMISVAVMVVILAALVAQAIWG
jgi:hypothetical protein